MKHIVKGADPPELVEFKAAGNDDWTPEYDALPGDKKRAIHDALLAEQGQICCYCMRRIDSETSHIEHWQPQTLPPDLALEYGNMLASCQRDIDPGEPLRCGMRKGNWFDPPVMISPLKIDCEKRFRFTAGGEILPKHDGDHAALESIGRLGLDLPITIALRSEAIGAIIDDLDDLTAEDLRTLARQIVLRDADGLFPVFCMAISQILTSLISNAD